jgi:hypothetical protein
MICNTSKYGGYHSAYEKAERGKMVWLVIHHTLLYGPRVSMIPEFLWEAGGVNSRKFNCAAEVRHGSARTGKWEEEGRGERA